MTIALWCATDGFSEYKWFAVIDGGEIVRGEFHTPPEVDLADEEALLHRYTGPGVVASRLDGLDIEALKRAETILDEPRFHAAESAIRRRRAAVDTMPGV